MGYTEAYIKSLVRLVNSLGEWLEEDGKCPRKAGRAELEAYIADQNRSSRGQLLAWTRLIRRLPAMMAPLGALCRPEPSTFSGSILEGFATYLKNALGVTPNTIKT